MNHKLESYKLAVMLVLGLSPDEFNSGNRIKASEKEYIKKEIEYWQGYFYEKLTEENA